MRVLGPRGERGAIVGFVMEKVHPHDLTTFADQLRPGLARWASLQPALDAQIRPAGNDAGELLLLQHEAEIDRMIEILRDAMRFFS